MKRTKNMMYKTSDESLELTLFIENDSYMYNRIKAVLKTLQKHYKKHEYSEDKAVDAYYSLCCEASKRYMRMFGNVRDWNQVFDVTARFTTAVHLEMDFRHMLKEDSI